MIITFNLFESITDGLKMACLITLSEYKEKITPIIKSFNKFVAKNDAYLKNSDYYGVIYNTYDEYIEKAKKKYESVPISKHYNRTWDESWEKDNIEKKWLNHKPIPTEIKKTYNEYLDFFKFIFGEKYLTKIEPDETGSNKRAIKRAIDDETYINLLKDNKLNYERFEEILASVGLKVPVSFNKQLNHKPKEIIKTEEEVLIIYDRIKIAFDKYIKNQIKAYNLVPRMTKNLYNVRYSDVTMFKYIVDNWNFLTDEQKSELRKNDAYLPYIERVKEYIVKAGEKNINFADNSVYIKIINETKIAIQPAIDSHKEVIKENILKKQKSILLDKETLSEIGFAKKWGIETGKEGVYNLISFYNSIEGKLLIWNTEDTNKYIKKVQDEYQKKEHDKLSLMFYKIKNRFPNIIDFKFLHTTKDKNGLEFRIKGYDSEKVIYFIETNIIFAGGYNIQVFHMRWLMNVSVNGKRIASFKSTE